ncbi:MAG: hypothetical protein AB7N24_22490 [Dehalococcoidia bacterium]
MAGLPTPQELRTLPRWAIVAYAARCARRVLPLHPGDSRDHPLVASEISVAEMSAAGDTGAARAAADATQAAAIARAAGAARAAEASDAARAADAAAAAAYAAYDADDAYYAAARAADAAHAAYYAVARAAAYAAYDADAAAAADAARAAALRDYELLVTAAASWTEDTHVPPEFFGPIWPDGEPVGWSAAVHRAGGTKVEAEFNQNPDLSIEVFVDPGDATEEEVQELFDALSELNVELGGSGVVFNTDKMPSVQPEEAER